MHNHQTISCSYQIDNWNQNNQLNKNNSPFVYCIELHFYIGIFLNNYDHMFLQDILIWLARYYIILLSFYINLTNLDHKIFLLHPFHTYNFLYVYHMLLHCGNYIDVYNLDHTNHVHKLHKATKQNFITYNNINKEKLHNKHRSQYRPAWPEWHRQRPDVDSHWALFIHMHFWRQVGGPK